MSPVAVVIWSFKNNYVLSNQRNYWNSKIKQGLERPNKQWIDVSRVDGKSSTEWESKCSLSSGNTYLIHTCIC